MLLNVKIGTYTDIYTSTDIGFQHRMVKWVKWVEWVGYVKWVGLSGLEGWAK